MYVILIQSIYERNITRLGQNRMVGILQTVKLTE